MRGVGLGQFWLGMQAGLWGQQRTHVCMRWSYGAMFVFFQVWCLWFLYSERLATMPPVNINSNKQGLELPLQVLSCIRAAVL